MKTRNLCFAFFGILAVVVFLAPLKALVDFSFHDRINSYIPLIPLVSVVLVFLERRKIFPRVQYSWGWAAILLLVGIVLYWAARRGSLPLSENDTLSGVIFSVVLIWMAGFALCYGKQALRAAGFPLLFLFFIVPIPGFLRTELILALQKGSAATAYWLFTAASMPVLREGFLFSLPGVDIEIAQHCGGINSTLALLIA